MKKIKRLLVVLLAFAMSLSAAMLISASVYADGIGVTIDGAAVNFADQQPVIIDGRTLVPVRAVFEALGFQVEWSESRQEVALVFVNCALIIPIGDPYMFSCLFFRMICKE